MNCTPSLNIIQVIKWRRIKWVGHVAGMGERRGVHRVLVGKPEGKRLRGRPRHRWEDNIKMDTWEGDGDAWVSLIWFKIGTGGRHL